MIEFKKVEDSHLSDLRKISIKTFEQAFSDFFESTQLNGYLNEAFDLDKIKQEFEKNNSEFYFSFLDKQLIGYLKLNYHLNHHKDEDPDCTELQRIYLLNAYKGKGYGKSLLNFAIEKARVKKSKSIWLSTGEENESAIKFYMKNNFEEIDKQFLELGSKKVRSIVMQLSL